MTVPLIGWLTDCLLKTCVFCWLVNSWFINCKNVSITGYSEKKLLPSDFNYLLRTMYYLLEYWAYEETSITKRQFI